MSDDLGYDPGPGIRPIPNSEATGIEQTRSIAQVHAAILAAQNFPRVIHFVNEEMRKACSDLALADNAFWRFPRDGKQLTGPNVHLARELKRIYGNIESDVVELARYEDQSEVLVWAHDLEKNVRNVRTMIVPHWKDVNRSGRSTKVKITAYRDITEHIQSQGARAEREVILQVLPRAFVDEAISICNDTIKKHSDAKSVIANFQDQFGISLRQLEGKVGAKVGDWSPQDLATLRVVGGALARGEASLEDEFPQRRLTYADIEGTHTHADTPESVPEGHTAPETAHHEVEGQMFPPKKEKSE